jgi:hypothetical protein
MDAAQVGACLKAMLRRFLANVYGDERRAEAHVRTLESDLRTYDLVLQHLWTASKRGDVERKERAQAFEDACALLLLWDARRSPQGRLRELQEHWNNQKKE